MQNDDDMFPIPLDDTYVGQQGRLLAIVRAVRDNKSIVGHRLLGLKYRAARVGGRYTLAIGTLFFANHLPNCPTHYVGVIPSKPVKGSWLNEKMLSRLHNQTVTLFFDPISDTN